MDEQFKDEFIQLGLKIAYYRKRKGYTQEQLAELLGLSTNAISQWECDKTAPDISNLPVLANIFEVSADILLEIDIAKSKKQAEIEEFKAKYAKLHSQGKTEERVLLSRAMQKKYPNDETVRHHLMRALYTEDTDKYFEEIVSLLKASMVAPEEQVVYLTHADCEKVVMTRLLPT